MSNGGQHLLPYWVTSDSSRYCLGTVAPPPDIDVDPAMMTASKGAEHGAIRD
jgi:hypothetical protein